MCVCVLNTHTYNQTQCHDKSTKAIPAKSEFSFIQNGFASKSLIIINLLFRQSNNNDGEYDAGDDISDDNGENDENSSLCECYNTWRRASNDGDDDDELHENTGTSTKKHKSFHNGQNNGTDSGCDSDCPENISELCKKFDENLSEQDVS